MTGKRPQGAIIVVFTLTLALFTGCSQPSGEAPPAESPPTEAGVEEAVPTQTPEPSPTTEIEAQEEVVEEEGETEEAATIPIATQLVEAPTAETPQTEMSPEPTATEAAPLPESTVSVVDSKVWGADGMVLVYVPEGTFTMGSLDSELDWIMSQDYCSTCSRLVLADEQPQHEVYLDAFWIDQTEVTCKMFAAFLNATGTKLSDTGQLAYGEGVNNITYSSNAGWKPLNRYENVAVGGVSWYAAEAYCRWVGRRLPTEAEWEKAARGTDARIFPWGNEVDCSYAHYYGCEHPWPIEVGSFPKGASPYGALDMAAGQDEWVFDYYAEDYYSKSPDTNPQGPASGNEKVTRGGYFSHNPDGIRAASRMSDLLEDALGAGFRCALSVEKEKPTIERTLYLTTPHMMGNDVIALQQRLLELGYSEVGGADGDFGSMTDVAVRRFQEVNGLTVDGVVGPITWEALFSDSALSP